MEIECHRCGYAWDTNTKHFFVSCPSCLTKVKVKEVTNDKKDE